MTRAIAVALLVGCVACGPSETTCGAGEERRDDRCVPCGASRVEIGGVCRPTGLKPEHCAEGFVHDATRGTCEPTLPSVECPAGSAAFIGYAECRPVGVRTCAAGFVADGAGGCTATLPPKKCADGTIAVPGEAVCRPISPCAPGTWGDIAVEAATLYVDAAFAGGSSDGSSARPFVTIQAAVDAAGPDASVAVAAGAYVESVRITKKLRLSGVCPARVSIEAPPLSSVPAVWVTAAATGTVLRGFAVSGPTIGVAVEGASATLDRLWVHDTGSVGMQLTGTAATSINVMGVLVERATSAGVLAAAAPVTLDRCAVRDTRGRGVQVQRGAALTLRHSLIEGNRDIGVVVFGARATLTGSVVKDTLPRDSDRTLGVGVSAEVDSSSKVGSVLDVIQCSIEKNHETGIALFGSEGTVVDTVVRDTQPRLSDKTRGRGINASPSSVTAARSKLTVRWSSVERNRETGIGVFGSDAVVEGALVRGTLARASDGAAGRGVTSAVDVRNKGRASVALRDSLIEGNLDAGLFALGADLIVERCTIQDTGPQPMDLRHGDGVSAQSDLVIPGRPSVQMKQTLVRRNFGAIALFGADATLEGCVFQDSRPDAAGRGGGIGVYADLDPTTLEPTVLALVASLVERSHEGGVVVWGSDARIERCNVRESRPIFDNRVGDGIAAIGMPESAATLAVSDTVVHDSSRAGIALLGASMSLARSRVTCSAFDLNLEPGRVATRTSDLRDLGDNGCGCGALGPCRAQSAQLVPTRSPAR